MKYLIYWLLTISVFAQTTSSDFYRTDLSAKTAHHWILDSAWVADNTGKITTDRAGSTNLLLSGITRTEQSGTSPNYVVGNGLLFESPGFLYTSPALTDDFYGCKVVFRPATTITAATSPQMLMHLEGGFYGVILGAASGAISNEIITVVDASSNKSYWASATDSISSQHDQILILMWDGSKHQIWLNGKELTTSTDGTPAVFGMDTNFRIGLRADNTLQFTADVFEVKIYDAQLTDAEVIAESFLPSGWHCNNTGAVRQDSSGTWAFNIGAVSDTLYYNPGVSGRYTVTLDALAEASSTLKLFSGSSSATNAVGTVSAQNTYPVVISGNLNFANASADSVWWDNLGLTKISSANNGSFGGWGKY